MQDKAFIFFLSSSENWIIDLDTWDCFLLQILPVRDLVLLSLHPVSCVLKCFSSYCTASYVDMCAVVCRTLQADVLQFQKKVS